MDDTVPSRGQRTSVCNPLKLAVFNQKYFHFPCYVELGSQSCDDGQFPSPIAANFGEWRSLRIVTAPHRSGRYSGYWLLNCTLGSRSQLRPVGQQPMRRAFLKHFSERTLRSISTTKNQ